MKCLKKIHKKIFDIFEKSVNERGLPAKIFVRDDWYAGFMEDLCGRLDIELEEGERLKAIDDYLVDMVEQLGKQEQS